MQLKVFFSIALALTGSACNLSESRKATCTLEAIGPNGGSGNLKAILTVPAHYIYGPEIKNGGVTVERENCDFSLNALFASETIEKIIAEAPTRTLTDKRHGIRLIEADMDIWKFSDSSGEPQFFVTKVRSMYPVVAPRNELERNYYELRQDVS